MLFAHVNGGGAGLGEAGPSFVEICKMQISLSKSKGVFGTQRGLSLFVFTASQSTGRVYWFLADPCAAPVVGHSYTIDIIGLTMYVVLYRW